jgi:hypothetical protein
MSCIQTLLQLILRAFVDETSVDIFLASELNKPPLAVFAGGTNLEQKLYNMIRAAEAEGWTRDLISALQAKRPHLVSKLQPIADELAAGYSLSDLSAETGVESSLTIKVRVLSRQLARERGDVQRGTGGLPSIFADYVEEKTKGFVGRAHVFAHVQEFLTSSSRGYLTIIGEPGIGKSAISCELTRTMSCVAHFFIRSDGITKADQFYTYIGNQLRDRFGIDTTSSLDEAPGIRLKRWLTEAAATLDGDKLVFVVDALDECEEVDKQDRAGNLLYLPRVLPEGVYFLMSRRPLATTESHLRLETEPGVANQELDLRTFSSENRRDVEQYIRAYFNARPAHAWLACHSKSVDEAVALLGERSEDNFMYLRHVLPHLEKNPEDFTPARLPKGLTEYYLGHWDRMTARWRGKQEAESVFDTIYVLAKAQRPMTSGQIEETLPGVPDRLVGTFIGQWREFLEESGQDEPTFRIYHASFADFLAEQDPIDERGKKAARLLKGWFLSRLRSVTAGS